MNQRPFCYLLGFFTALTITQAQAVLSRSAADLEAQFQTSDAVLLGTLTGSQASIDSAGRIETRYTIRVLQPLKGRFPKAISLYLPGGTVAGQCVQQGCQPTLKMGEERLFFLMRGKSGRLHLNGDLAGAPSDRDSTRLLPELARLSAASTSLLQDFGDQAASGTDPVIIGESDSTAVTNLFTDNDPRYGLPARYLGPDRGHPIPYLVDADSLPAGMTLDTAMTALGHALSAWSSVAFLDFRFEGFASFGMSAADINTSDERLRIQLHNSYGEIANPSTLGIGGQGISYSVLANGWTTGGRVYANDFQMASRGYVVLNHTSASMQNPVTFEEVLCHEIGHALGMMHSSEDVNEPTASPAYQAIMYYLVHGDGRGAAPTDYDIGVLQQAYPPDNSPPYSFDRVMDVITASTPPSIPGVNEVLLGGDLQSSSLTAELYDATLPGNGTFSVVDNKLKYAPAAFWSDAPRLDPEANSSRGSIYYRLEDGVHASPWARVRVLSFSQDTQPSGSIDGMPDNWMVSNFGNANPAAGPDRGADDDFDGDGLTNREEYRSWMDPNAVASAQRASASSDGTVSWQAKAYEAYELWSSFNLTDWSFEEAVLATNEYPSVYAGTGTAGLKAYRVLKVP